MTTNQHGRPLAPGEIRTHEVNGEIFQVMHVADGRFTQARRGSTVITTSIYENVALALYATAIDAAEQHVAMSVADECLDLILATCRQAEDEQAGGDTYAAAATLALGMGTLAGMLAPYADAMPLPYPHTILVLTNGSTIRTTSNAPGDIAGLINAGAAKIYQCTDLTDGMQHNVMVNAILDFYQVTS